MNRTLPCTLLILSAACGGSWSNRDLDFITVLPDRAALKSKLPTTASSTSPLTGVTTRRDGLNVGDPSDAYAQTLSASNSFNGILDFLLTILDTVRAVTPTSRTPDSRTWGPWADNNNPGYEFKVTIANVPDGGADLYDWSLQARKGSGDYFNVVVGQFDPTISAKKGSGVMNVSVADFRDKLTVDNTFQQLDQIAIQYDTASSPSTVKMAFAFRADSDAGVSGIGYEYHENADLSGTIFYELRTTSSATTVLDTTAGFLANGQGRAQEKVIAGTYAGFTLSECWDSAFKVTLYSEGWPGGVTNGAVANCPTIPGM